MNFEYRTSNYRVSIFRFEEDFGRDSRSLEKAI